MNLNIDHLVIAAPTLEAGVRWCETTLGVTPGPGGRHALMGTHNRLMRMTTPAFPQAYLEVIAIDPGAPPPGRARWFELDRRAPDAPVQLVHVVMNTDDLPALRAAFLAEGLDPGPAVAAQRDTPDGTLQWTLTVRDDGRLPLRGALPTLIQWRSRHPTETMTESGLAMRSLTLRGLPAALRQALAGSGTEFADGPGPALQATLRTPRGTVALASA